MTGCTSSCFPVRYSGALDLNVQAIEDALRSPNASAVTPVTACCSASAETLSYSAKFGTSIDSAAACSVSASDSTTVKPAVSDAVTGAFKRNLLGAPSGLKWQYYIPENLEEFPQLEFPTARFSCGLAGAARHKRQYFQTARAAAGPRAVVIVFDRGSAMTERQLDLSRAVVRFVLATISARDLIGFVAVAGSGGGVYTPLQPTPRDCLLSSLVPASADAVLRLSKFVNVVQAAGEPTDHGAALAAVAEMSRNSRDVEGLEGGVRLLYLTNGIDFPADLPASFNTSKIVLDGYLLNADAERGSNLRKLSESTGGRLKIIDSTRGLAATIGNYFEETVGGAAASGETFLYPPTWDPVGGWTVFSLAQRVPGGGVAGIDVHAPQLLEDFIYFDEGGAGGAYPILAERVGSGSGSQLEVVYHPATFALGSPARRTLLSELEGVKIGRLERRAVLSQPKGSATTSQDPKVALDWKWVDETPYVVIVLAERPAPSRPTPETRRGAAASADLLFHRLDLAKDAIGCRYFSTAANVERSTLFLSPVAFDSPSRHLGRDPASALNVSALFD